MTLEFNKQGPALTRSELDAYAKKHRLSIPEPLAEFLLEHNGGRLGDRYAAPVGDGTNTAALTFLGAFAGKPELGQRDLHARASIRDNRPATWLTPFAEDGFGNVFAISAREQDLGSVWFWDHETNKSRLVLPTFEEFLESIHYSAPPAIDPSSFRKIINAATLEEIASRLPSELEDDAVSTRYAIARSTRLDVLRWMIDNGYAEGMLLMSAQQANPAFVDELLARGLDPNETDDEGATVLMKAIECRNRAIVERLLAAGADPDRQDDSGEDAFRKAEDYSFPLRQLLKGPAGNGKKKAGKKAAPVRKKAARKAAKAKTTSRR